MTYASDELSLDSASPIELLKISFELSSWFYTNAAQNVVFDGDTYLAVPMSRDALRPTGDTSKASMTFQLPHDSPVGELFRIHPPSGVVSVTAFAKNIDKPDNEFIVFWKGRVLNSVWEPPYLKLTTEHVISSMQRVGLRRKYSATCPYDLYGEHTCKVSRAAQRRTLQVVSTTGVSVVFSGGSFTDNFFAGGYLEWLNAEKGYTERRMIRSSSQAGSSLELSMRPVGMNIGQLVYAYPGCDHSATTCHTKFNNSLEYGGMPFIPKKNPFNGTAIY